jgi:hypothetical protein
MQRKNTCPVNMLSPPGARAISECVCPDSFFIDEFGACALCPPGSYCLNSERFFCPSGAKSLQKSSRLANCTCGNGFRPGLTPADPCQACS